MPLYANKTSTKDLITESRVYKSFFYETAHRSFRCRSDSVALAQRDCINNPSVYIVNRKSLMVNKTQVNYNDDGSNVLCAPLSVNTLKWSEPFMGDAMMYDLWCKYEEPLRRIASDFDCPKVSLFRVASNDYSFSPPSNTDHICGHRIEFRDYDATSILMKMKDLPKRLDTCQYVERRATDWANDTNDASGILWSHIISDIWSSNSCNLMRNENDEIISFDGLFGSCFSCQIYFECRRQHFNRMMQMYHYVNMEGEHLPRLFLFTTSLQSIIIVKKEIFTTDKFWHIEWEICISSNRKLVW